MSDEHVLYETRGPVGLLTINRPAKRNGFTIEMFKRLAALCTEADADEAIRCLVVNANGPDFTTGLDLMNVGPSFRQGEVPIEPDQVDLWNVIGRLRTKPLVVAVHGRCFTLGTELALAADVCVAASDTRFALKEVSVGIIPAGGGTFRFVGAAGYGNAMRYVLSGDEFDASEAYRLNVVAEIAAPGEQLERALAIADSIAAQAPLAVRSALAHAQIALLDGWRAAISEIVERQIPLMNSADAMEAAMAMMQKRPPTFSGT